MHNSPKWSGGQEDAGGCFHDIFQVLSLGCERGRGEAMGTYTYVVDDVQEQIPPPASQFLSPIMYSC